MSALTQKAQELKRSLPPERTGSPPVMKGQLLGTLPHKEGEVRIVWDTFEGHAFLSVRLWTVDDNGQHWPSKNGFTVRVRDLPTLGEAVGRALDKALEELQTTGGSKTHYRNNEGVNAPF